MTSQTQTPHEVTKARWPISSQSLAAPPSSPSVATPNSLRTGWFSSIVHTVTEAPSLSKRDCLKNLVLVAVAGLTVTGFMLVMVCTATAQEVPTQTQEEVLTAPATEAESEITRDSQSEAEVMVLDVPTLIVVAAREYGLPETRMLRIAKCESTFNPLADGGGYVGVFQFSVRTWLWASAAAGFEGYDRRDAIANIWTAAWLAKNDGFQHWTCK